MKRLEVPLGGPEEMVFEATEGEGLSEAQVGKFLSAILRQAMNDGMTAIRLGITAESGEPFMKYFGPAWYDEPTWWEMVPPPREAIQQIASWCESAACPSAIDAAQSEIPAVAGERRFGVCYRRDAACTELRWDAALARQQSEPRDAHVARFKICGPV
jgi:hypothetical protein